MEPMQHTLQQKGTGHFHFAPIPPEIMKLSEELKSLGAARATVGETTVVARIAPAGKLERRIVGAQGATSVTVDDPDVRDTTSLAQARKTYALDAALGADSSQADVYGKVQEVVPWVMRGLNASIVALGQHGTGKTYSLFGPGGPHSVEHVGLVPLLLDELARAADEHPGRFALGLSAWEIQGTEAVDLLATEGAGADDGRVEFPIVPGTWLEFTTVAVNDVDEMQRAVEIAQHRSCSWGEGHAPEGRTHARPGGAQGAADARSGPPVPLPNRAHFFLRVSVYDRSRSSLSALHLVDLVGSRRAPGHAAPAPPPDALSRVELERRAAAQDLLSLSRLILDLSKRPDPEGGDALAPRLVPAAKDCKLTRALAPLLGGNCRAWILCTLSPRPEDYLETMDTLRLGVRARAIRTACLATSGIDESAVDFLPLERVVPTSLGLAAEVDRLLDSLVRSAVDPAHDTARHPPPLDTRLPDRGSERDDGRDATEFFSARGTPLPTPAPSMRTIPAPAHAPPPATAAPATGQAPSRSPPTDAPGSDEGRQLSSNMRAMSWEDIVAATEGKDALIQLGEPATAAAGGEGAAASGQVPGPSVREAEAAGGGGVAGGGPGVEGLVRDAQARWAAEEGARARPIAAEELPTSTRRGEVGVGMREGGAEPGGLPTSQRVDGTAPSEGSPGSDAAGGRVAAADGARVAHADAGAGAVEEARAALAPPRVANAAPLAQAVRDMLRGPGAPETHGTRDLRGPSEDSQEPRGGQAQPAAAPQATHRAMDAGRSVRRGDVPRGELWQELAWREYAQRIQASVEEQLAGLSGAGAAGAGPRGAIAMQQGSQPREARAAPGLHEAQSGAEGRGSERRDVGIGSPVSPVGERSLWRDVDTSRRSGDAGPAVAVARELSLSNGGECWADLDAVAPPEVPGDAGARVGAHAQGSWRGREAAELEAELRVVMRALELERTRGDKEAARARELEMELQEFRLTRELAADETRVQALALRQQMRAVALASAGDAAEVFEAYERDLEEAMRERDALELENRRLRVAQAGEAGPRGPGAPLAATTSGLRLGRAVGRDAKVDVLRRELARATEERDALRHDLDAARKAQRALLVNRRQARAAHQRLREMQESLAARERDLVEQALRCKEAEAVAEETLEQMARMEEHLNAMARENRQQRQDIKALREQIFNLRLAGDRGGPLAGAAMVRPIGEGPPRGETRALELLKQLQGHLPRYTRAEEILERLISEINYIARERQAMHEREKLLVQVASAATEQGMQVFTSQREAGAPASPYAPAVAQETPLATTPRVRYSGRGMQAVTGRT